MDKQKKKEIVERIMREMENNYWHYREFIFDCIRTRVESWDDEELQNWIGKGEGEEDDN